MLELALASACETKLALRLLQRLATKFERKAVVIGCCPVACSCATIVTCCKVCTRWLEDSPKKSFVQ